MYIYLDILFFLQEATKIAETMVKSFGMSDKVGFRSIMENKDFFGSSTTYAPSTNEIIDNEVKRLLQVNFVNFSAIRFMSHSLLFTLLDFFSHLQESYERAKTILKMHAKEHKQLAEALLQYETLDAEDVAAIANGKQHTCSFLFFVQC
jgi:ATP-dependent metalloprotease